MAGLPPIDLENWLFFLLIWARLLGFVFLFPYFSYRGIPLMMKIWLALIVAFLIFFSNGARPEIVLSNPLLAVLYLGKEVLVGLALGYLVVLMFSLFINAGQMVDLKSGLMLSGVFEPQFGSQVTYMGQLYYLLALVFYLTLNGHHYFIRSLADSFTLIPVGEPFMDSVLTEGVIGFFAELFALSFQLVAPIIIILMILDIALGLLAKTVPQVHVFIEGLPLKIAFSMLLFAVLLPLFGTVWEGLLDHFTGFLYQFMKGW